MTASKFKVGDRVVHHSPSGANKGSVVNLIGDLIEIKFEARSTTTCVHSKACRRLIKKPRRRVWIHASCFDELEDSKNFESIRDNPMVFTRISSGQTGLIEFIEVKKRGG